MSSLSFSEVYASRKLNDSFEMFYDLITLFYNLCFPIITTKITEKRNNVIWLTSGLNRSCIMKRRLYFKYIKSSHNKNRNKYIKYSKILRKCITNSQKIHNNRYILRHSNKCKASWIIRQTTNHKNSK